MMDDEESASNTALLAWAASEGVVLDVARVGRNKDGMRGVLVSSQTGVRENSVVCSVPRHLMLGASTADDCLKEALQQAGISNPRIVLALVLLKERDKGRTGRWWPYIRALPASYTTLPFLTEETRSELQVASAIALAARKREEAENEWKQAQPVLAHMLREEDLQTFEAWLWACATISTRTVSVPFEDIRTGALCPIADLFNYEPAVPATPPLLLEDDEEEQGRAGGGGGESRELVARNIDDEGMLLPDGTGGYGAFNKATKNFEVYTSRAYSCGEEILLCYGSYSNIELLEHYGFVLPAMKADSVAVPDRVLEDLRRRIDTDIDTDNGSRTRTTTKVKTTTREGYSTRTKNYFIHRCGRPSWDLLCLLRLAVLDRSERRRARKGIACGIPLPEVKEKVAMRLYYQAMLSELTSFVTTAQEDEKELAATLLPPHLVQSESGGGGGAEMKKDTDTKTLVADKEDEEDTGVNGVNDYGSWRSGGGGGGALRVVVLQYRLSHKRILQRAVKLGLRLSGDEL